MNRNQWLLYAILFALALVAFAAGALLGTSVRGEERPTRTEIVDLGGSTADLGYPVEGD